MSRVISISSPGASFSLSFQLMSHWVINEVNLLKFHGNLLKMLGKQVHILLDTFNIFEDLLSFIKFSLKIKCLTLKLFSLYRVVQYYKTVCGPHKMYQYKE
jgi:hypothetical protein